MPQKVIFYNVYGVVRRKIAQSSMLRHFAAVCGRITQFYQNAQKLTGNMKNGQILNIVIKYSLFGSWLGNYLKSVNIGDISRLS